VVYSASDNRISLAFHDKSKEIGNAPTIVDTLTRSPADPSMVCIHVACVLYMMLVFFSYITSQVVLLSGDYKHLYVSLDSGNSWHKHQTPSNSFDDAHDMLLSSVDPNRIIITDNTSQVRTYSVNTLLGFYLTACSCF